MQGFSAMASKKVSLPAIPRSLGLTDLESRVVQAVAFTGQSAEEICNNITLSRARFDAMLQSRNVAAAIAHCLEIRMRTEGAALATRTLFEIVENQSKTYSERVRLDAAKTLLDRAGFDAKNAPPAVARAGSGRDAPQSEAELRAEIERLEGQLADRSAQDGAQEAPQVIDML
jgi:hypothetical protein